jgi:hypothetical protein
MVCASPLTLKLCETAVAAAYVELPACVACMVQVPEVIKVAVVLETVQTLEVVEAKLTARPELAEAESVSGVPTVCAAGAVKVMVCAVRLVPPPLVEPPPPPPQADRDTATDKTTPRLQILLQNIKYLHNTDS